MYIKILINSGIFLIGVGISNLIHELVHLITMKLLGVELSIFNSYPISIINKNNKLIVELKLKEIRNISQAYVIPRIGQVHSDADIKLIVKKLVFIHIIRQLEI